MSSSPGPGDAAIAAMAAETREITLELAARLAARSEPITLDLTSDEFNAYTTSLRNYMHRADAYDTPEWKRRMRALDLLRDVRDALGGDNIDTAYLWACNESRRVVLGDLSPYRLVLPIEFGDVAVLALDEYRWYGPKESQPHAATLLNRITAEVGR